MTFPDLMRTSLKTYILCSVAFWTLLVSLFGLWSWWHSKQEMSDLAAVVARESLDKDILYRHWASGHGGVYVPASRETPPNPHLAHLPERDVTTPSGRVLTLLNPAYMTRQVHDLARELYGVRGRIVSLNPLRAENIPDPWEKEALEYIAQGEKEYVSVAQVGGAAHLRVMRVVYTEKECLKCHGEQGYQEGDIRGGVAVSVPMAPYTAMLTRHAGVIIFSHAVVWLAGMGGLLFAGLHLSRQLRTVRQLEEVRRQNEERLYLTQFSVDSAKDCIFWIDESARFCFVNNAVCQRLGYSREELLAMRIFDIDPCFTPEQWSERWQELLTHKALTLETTHRTRQGEIFPVEVVANLVEHGGTLYNCVFARDISERRQAEAALQESESRLRKTQDMAKIGAWELDFVSNRMIWSEQVHGIFEIVSGESAASYDAFLGMVHPEDRVLVGQAYNDALSTGNPCEIVHRLLMPDGRVKYVQERCEIFRDPEGRPVRSVGMLQDISELKRAEQAFLQAGQEWMAAMDVSDDVIYLLDLGRRVVRANRKFYLVTGTTPETVIGRHVVDVVHPEGKTSPCPMCRAQEERRDLRMIMESDHPDNYFGGVPLEITVQVVRDQKEDPLSFLVILRDLTLSRKEMEERLRLEKQLQQAQKMEAIGTLAGGIAHDFNNILTPILAYTEMALETVAKESRTAADLHEVLTAAGRAKDLVRQILAFSRQGEQEMQLQKIQFIIKEALKLLRASIPSSIEIRQEIDPECGPVLADPTNVLQIIMNLCTNAYHAMRETGGILRMTLSQVELGPHDLISKVALAPGPYARLEVSDTGHGIDRKTMERIFDPYFSTKDAGEGTGLGLAVAHGIVKSLRGEISVYSEPGQGTTFYVYLPVLTTEILETAEEKEFAPLPRGNEMVLVVDDEEMVAAMEEKLLTGLGYRVAVYADPAEALAAFRSRPQDFDLIVSDMTMPGLNGCQLSREILALRPEIPVVICTGFSELLSAETIKEAGARKVLMKPLLVRDFAHAIREVLDAESERAPRKEVV